MRILSGILLSMLIQFSAYAQQSANDSALTKIDSTSSDWSFAAEAYYYIFPHEKDITTLYGYADYKSVHFETRYNYEDLNTASLFGGYRFETGEKIVAGVTPMAGIVVGNTNGIAPGLLIDIAWKKLDFYSESEYVIDFEGKYNNFFYTWHELAITPIENLRTGISANRTRLFQSSLEFQRGMFVQYSFWKATAGVHYFNPFTNDHFLIATLGIDF